MTALLAKFRIGPVRLVAVWTARIERRPALVTKTCIIGIFGLALRADHKTGTIIAARLHVFVNPR